MMQQAAALAATVAILGLTPSTANAAEANASLPDIEDEVMCTICGTALQLSDSPQADRERAFINELIAQGQDKEQIKDALVDEYGTAVLASPPAEGFDLVAWLVPIGGVLAGVVIIGVSARRWRRSGAGRGDVERSTSDEIDPADDERLRADIGRYQV